MEDNHPVGRRRHPLEAPRTDELDGLRREIADLRASRERLALAVDDERRSFERALHDGLQQQLVGLAANLELVAASVDSDPAATASLLAALRDDLRGAIEETRNLAYRIYPPLLEAGGLAPALREAATRADVRVAIEIAAGTALSPEVASAIYFSSVDALERAGAGASATISVRADEAIVSFEIDVDRDLGMGSPPTSRDHVEALGGSLDIDQTRLVGSLPRSR
jgi:signal transduction histidine kinase